MRSARGECQVHMTFSDVLVLAVAASLLANAIHWMWSGAGRFLSFPETGWLHQLFAGWIIVIVVAALAYWLRLIPTVAFQSAGVAFFVVQQVYSIAQRRRVTAA